MNYWLGIATAAIIVIAGTPWRSNARQDACREADRIAGRGQGYCDELALRQAKRACPAFELLGERSR